MVHRLSLVGLVVLLAACNDDQNEGPAQTSDGPCWYCVGDGIVLPDGSSNKDGGKGGSKALVLWSGSIDRKAKTGSYTYAVYAAGSKTPDCSLTYAVEDLSSESCPTCTFAHGFKVGKMTKQTNPSKCAKGTGVTGEKFVYGHTAATGGKGGFALVSKVGDQWKEVGSSSLKGDLWTFTVFGAKDGVTNKDGGSKSKIDAGSKRKTDGGSNKGDGTSD